MSFLRSLFHLFFPPAPTPASPVDLEDLELLLEDALATLPDGAIARTDGLTMFEDPARPTITLSVEPWYPAGVEVLDEIARQARGAGYDVRDLGPHVGVRFTTWGRR